MLKKSAKTVAQTLAAISNAALVVVKNLKKIVLTTNMGDLIRLLPLLPPVVIGIYVLFGAFWPKRQLFFSKGQRTGAGLEH